MFVKEIQKSVDSLHYWDARVTRLNCNYFADEVELLYEDEGTDIIYKFIGCYKSNFFHDKKYNKNCPVKEMRMQQIPYFLQDVKIGEKIEDGLRLYTCKINMYPLDLEIWCKDIKIIKREKER
jgi:hypothetical protein